MKSAPRIALIAASALLVSGCASKLAGLGGSQSYACKAPEGVLCTSVAGVYANSLQNNLPSQRTDKRGTEGANKVATAARIPVASAPAPDSASIRSAPRVLRVWLSAWEDSDGDLQDQSFLYVVVDSGHWLIEHQRASVRDAFTPIAAPALPAASEASEPAPSANVNLPRPGAPSSPANTTPFNPPKMSDDAESTLR